VFTFLVVLGATVAMMPGLSLIRVLIVTQVINGMLLPVILVAVLKLVNNRELMGSHVNGPIYNVAAWLTTIAVSILSILVVVSSLFPNAF
jgi:Mn2+/Fe2+ NRAMP family transporter